MQRQLILFAGIMGYAITLTNIIDLVSNDLIGRNALNYNLLVERQVSFTCTIAHVIQELFSHSYSLFVQHYYTSVMSKSSNWISSTYIA